MQRVALLLLLGHAHGLSVTVRNLSEHLSAIWSRELLPGETWKPADPVILKATTKTISESFGKQPHRLLMRAAGASTVSMCDSGNVISKSGGIQFDRRPNVDGSELIAVTAATLRTKTIQGRGRRVKEAVALGDLKIGDESSFKLCLSNGYELKVTTWLYTTKGGMLRRSKEFKHLDITIADELRAGHIRINTDANRRALIPARAVHAVPEPAPLAASLRERERAAGKKKGGLKMTDAGAASVAAQREHTRKREEELARILREAQEETRRYQEEHGGGAASQALPTYDEAMRIPTFDELHAGDERPPLRSDAEEDGSNVLADESEDVGRDVGVPSDGEDGFVLV